jgi:hypothetical protein
MGITEHIFEVRHEALAKFLDIKGSIADDIKKRDLFSFWKIQENVISFSDQKDFITKDAGATVTYDRICFFAYKAVSDGNFRKNAINFLCELNKCKPYAVPPLTRFGLRIKSFIPATNMSFEEIYKCIATNLLNDKYTSILGEKQRDIHLTFEFEEKEFQVRAMIGPLKSDEAERHFRFKDEAFKENGLYVDVDYFKTGQFKYHDVKPMLEKATELAKKRIQQIADTILKKPL